MSKKMAKKLVLAITTFILLVVANIKAFLVIKNL